MEKQWAVVELRNKKEVHTIPTNDLREHEESANCWCNPRVEHEKYADVVVHNSLDKREYFEEGNEKYIPNCSSMTIIY